MDPNSLNGDLSASDEAQQNYWSLSAAQSSTIISLNPTSALYAAARVDQEPANYSQSQEGTSVANSHVPLELRHKDGKQREREALGTLDTEAAQTMTTTDGGSLFSYRSSRDLSTFLRELDGRMFNNQSDLYLLPSDDDEFQRLAKQHYAIALCMGGLYPCPDIVESVLDPAKHTDPLAPCGNLGSSGIWALDMSQKFPHASVVGVDLAPVSIDLASIPINLRFEIDDITMGLSHYHNGFDVVQARCISGGIPNYELMMQDAEACLRPGGVVIFMDGDTRVYLEDSMTPAPVPIDEDEPGGPVEGSWVHRLARETRYACAYHGCDIEGSEIAMDAGLWDHSLIDPETVRVAGLYTPVGSWASSPDMHQRQKLRYAGELMRQDITRVIRAWHPLLKLHGIPEQRIEEWTKRADEEIATMKYRISFHWRLTWGQRSMDTDSGSSPDTRSPTLSSHDHPDPQVVTSMEPPSVSSTAVPTSSNLVEFSHGTGTQDVDTASSTISPATNFQPLQIRATREEAKRVAKMRLEVTKMFPVCTVTRLRATVGLDESTDGGGSSEEA